MATHPDHERLHKLLRGELAAVQSYERALADAGAHDSRRLLESFLEDHRRAVSVLTRHLESQGHDVESEPGPWGAFTRAVEAAAAWIDDAHTLKALKEGEVHGADEYRTALGLGTVPAELRGAVERELLPRQVEHIEELDVLIARVERPDTLRSLPDRIHGRQPAR